MKTIAVILTGGKSSRMGQDKGLLLLEGESLLARQIRLYGGLCDGVCVSVDRPGRFEHAGAIEIADLRADSQGPLAGLETAFLATEAALVFLTAVDIPFGNPALARRLMELRGQADVCYIRRVDGRPEPLFAVYSRSCLPAITTRLDGGRRSFYGLFDQLHTRAVEEAELSEFDLTRILMNVNRPEDFQRAQHMLHT